MQLLIEQETQQAYAGLYADRPLILREIIAGGLLPLSLVRLQRIRNPFDARVFTPLDWIDWSDIRVSLGGAFQLPVSGAWPISFEDQTSQLLVPANPSAMDLQAALDLIDSIEDAGGIDVAGENGFFVLSFVEKGVRNLIEGDATDLVPLSVLEFKTALAGDVNTRAVQTLRIRQNVAASVELSDDSEPSEIALEEIQVGDAEHNHKVRVTLPHDRWGGSWTFTKGADESGLLGWDDNDAQIESVLESIETIGANNVSVRRESEDSYLIEFIVDLANTAIADLSVTGTALRLIASKEGALDLSGAGVDYLLNGTDSQVVTLEIEGIPPDGDAPVKLLSRDVVLRRAVTNS